MRKYRKYFSFESFSAVAFFCLLLFLSACATTGHSRSIIDGEPKSSKMEKKIAPASTINQQTEKTPGNELQPAVKPAPKTEKKPEKNTKPEPLFDDISPM
jgi:hypothetical protein